MNASPIRPSRSHAHRRPASAGVIALGLWVAASGACSGALGGPRALEEPAEGVTPTADDPNSAPHTKDFRAAPSALRKLTVPQYANTVRDLLGAELTLPELEADTSINGFFSIGAAKATVSPSAAEKFEDAAFSLATQALAASNRDSFVGCAPSAATDNACTTQFVARFGKRAFRRALNGEELARYVAVAEQAQTTLGDFHEGLVFAIAGLLQSPHFLFRVELGDADGGYDGGELATRLSYLLWNTTPDDALLEAAQRGELASLSGLRTQTDRLLAHPRAKVALDNFHSERLALEELDAVEKDGRFYAGFDDALRTTMRADVLRTIEAYAFEPERDFRDLFTTRIAFVDAKLAALYGLPSGSQGRVELPADGERVGLLGKAAFLAANAHADVTSPTRRGKYIRERLLCQSIPAPPPEVSTVLPAPDPSAPTMRQRLEAHVSLSSCAGCHRLIDPLGLSLEHFDAIGRYRADDAGHALDVRGALNGETYDGARALSELLRDESDASECVARQLYRYATAHVETDGEEPAVDAILREFADSGYRFTSLLRAVILSDGFRYGAKE